MHSGAQVFSSQVEQTAQQSDMRSRSTPDTPANPNNNDALTNQDTAYFGSWVISDARFAGNLAQTGYLCTTSDPNNADQDAQLSGYIANGCGFLTGIILHYGLKKYYKKTTATNPIFRTIDTLANVGSAVGETLGYFLDLPFLPKAPQRIVSLILADIIGISVALFAFPYWKIRELYDKTPANKRNLYMKTGAEGWSRYGKTGIVLGRNVGQITGFAFSHDNSTHTSQTMGMAGAAGAIGGFATSMIAVPIINKLTYGRLIVNEQCTLNILSQQEYRLINNNLKANSYYLINTGKKWELRYITAKGEIIVIDISQIDTLETELTKLCDTPNYEQNEIIYKLISAYHSRYIKNLFRNNYVRSGMTLGFAFGSMLGYVVGMMFPIIGPFVSAAVFAALSSIAGGIYIGSIGHELSDRIHKGKNVENSWDYTTRGTSTLFAAIGTIIGLFLPIPGGVILGAAIGGVIGWGVGVSLPEYARKLHPVEEKTSSITWTNRQDLGSNLGIVIGGLIGFGVGILGGPIGVIAGMTLGAAIGSVVGGSIAVLYEKCARQQVWRGIKDFFGIYDNDQVPAENSTDKPSLELDPSAPLPTPKCKPTTLVPDPSAPPCSSSKITNAMTAQPPQKTNIHPSKNDLLMTELQAKLKDKKNMQSMPPLPSSPLNKKHPDIQSSNSKISPIYPAITPSRVM